ncbi:MAG: hypothetical protein IJ892_10365 [Prevotella sp.]|nr:hypothetical protein [Prevotella sp.]
MKLNIRKILFNIFVIAFTGALFTGIWALLVSFGWLENPKNWYAHYFMMTFIAAVSFIVDNYFKHKEQ